MVYFVSSVCLPAPLIIMIADLYLSHLPTAVANLSLLPRGGGPLVCLFKTGGAENLTICFLKIDGIVLSPNSLISAFCLMSSFPGCPRWAPPGYLGSKDLGDVSVDSHFSPLYDTVFLPPFRIPIIPRHRQYVKEILGLG